MNFRYVLALIFGVQTSLGSSNSTFRKHKVHNIVLYPDKHSWCTSTSIKQVVSEVNCDPVEIDNRVCLGACFSYSIPRTLPSNNGDEIHSYCDSCQPVNTSWIPVQLTCAGGSKNQTKHVQLIDECRCASCGRRWQFERPEIGDAYLEDGITSTEASRYPSELTKLNKHDENAEDEEDNTDAPDTVANILNVAAADPTGLVGTKNIWIRGPHHSKILLKKGTVFDVATNEEARQYLREDTDDRNKL